MTPISNPRLIFNAIPAELPIPGKTTIYDDAPKLDLESVALQGGFLCKALAFSLDPYMRNRMRREDIPGDMPAFPLHETITGFGICIVLRSETSAVEVGEHLYGFMPFQHFTIFPSLGGGDENLQALGLKVVTNEYNIPWRYFVGIAGMTGQTAYYGMKDISDPKAGETIYVSAASGAVGHVVVQLAKSLGLKVIGSVGTDEKVEMVKQLGADHVFNWKTSDIREELKKHGPIDIYFDNVGGPTLEAAIENAAQKARFIICGAISQYNVDMSQAYGVRNLWLINRYRIKMEGLIVIDWDSQYRDEFYRTIPRKLASGQMKSFEHIYHGLETASQGLLDILTGENRGKAVVVISNE